MKIKNLRDKHKGQMCFLIGAGPSLHHIDSKQLNDYVTITVNSGILKNKDCDYFVTDDNGVSEWSYYSDVWESSCTKLLYKDKFEPSCRNKKDVVLYTHTWWFSPKGKKYNMEGLRLTKEEPIIGARTSMGSALHLAFLMGADPIVLLGSDCKVINGKRYFWQYWDKKKQPYRIKGHKFNKQTQNIGFSREEFVEYWTCLADVNKDIIGKDVDIIDASDGILECFPKMRIEEIMEKYKDRKK